jgi:uncharacterized protein YbcI
MTIPGTEHGNVAQAISNAMTSLLREHWGRGPTGVRTLIGHDHVICFLEDIFTPAERTLIQAGEGDVVVEARRAFQRAMEDRFRELVEGATGRRVRAFLSQVNTEAKISVEVFVLESDAAHPAPPGIA